VPRCAPTITCLLGIILCAPPARSGDAPAVMIAVEFDNAFSAASFTEMKGEFERIMLPAKLHIEWRMTADLTGREHFPRIVVARFSGDCEADPSITTGSASDHLGMTRAIDGDVSPFAELDCDNIRAMLAWNPARETTLQLQRRLGCAMARVLAHEFYHAVLKTRKHSARGIAKARLTPSELCCNPLGFDPDQMKRIGEALTPVTDSYSTSGSTTSPDVAMDDVFSLLGESRGPGEFQTDDVFQALVTALAHWGIAHQSIAPAAEVDAGTE
jgi:hypothetical protein